MGAAVEVVARDLQQDATAIDAGPVRIDRRAHERPLRLHGRAHPSLDAEGSLLVETDSVATRMRIE